MRNKYCNSISNSIEIYLINACLQSHDLKALRKFISKVISSFMAMNSDKLSVMSFYFALWHSIQTACKLFNLSPSLPFKLFSLCISPLFNHLSFLVLFLEIAYVVFISEDAYTISANCSDFLRMRNSRFTPEYL